MKYFYYDNSSINITSVNVLYVLLNNGFISNSNKRFIIYNNYKLKKSAILTLFFNCIIKIIKYLNLQHLKHYFV